MEWACRTYGRVDECIQSLVWKPKGKAHLENLGVDGRISTCDSKKSHWRVYRSDLAQEWDKWRALV